MIFKLPVKKLNLCNQWYLTLIIVYSKYNNNMNTILFHIKVTDFLIKNKEV